MSRTFLFASIPTLGDPFSTPTFSSTNSNEKERKNKEDNICFGYTYMTLITTARIKERKKKNESLKQMQLIAWVNYNQKRMAYPIWCQPIPPGLQVHNVEALESTDQEPNHQKFQVADMEMIEMLHINRINLLKKKKKKAYIHSPS